MYKLLFAISSFLVLFFACGNPGHTEEKPDRPKSFDEDELIGRYSAMLIANPRTQDEIDQNVILNFLIDSLFDFQKTASGIYYHIEKKGNGEHPNMKNKIIAHYHGTFLDGTVFDSSYKKGSPMMFTLDRVIVGWQEAIPMLSIGEKGTFIIPSRLAYGSKGFPGFVQPNTVLVFDIELINFK